MGIKMKAQNIQNQQLLFIIIPFSLRNYYFIWASKIIKLILNTSWKCTLKAASVRHSYSLSVQHLLCPSWLRTQIWGVVLVLRPSASPVGIGCILEPLHSCTAREQCTTHRAHEWHQGDDDCVGNKQLELIVTSMVGPGDVETLAGAAVPERPQPREGPDLWEGDGGKDGKTF